MSTPAKPAKRPLQPPCLCLECKCLECHGIGKPLTTLVAIQATAPKLCTCPSGKRCSP